jgi:hypothetical protein
VRRYGPQGTLACAPQWFENVAHLCGLQEPREEGAEGDVIVKVGLQKDDGQSGQTQFLASQGIQQGRRQA